MLHLNIWNTKALREETNIDDGDNYNWRIFEARIDIYLEG